MMKMPMKMEKKVTTLTTHHDAQYAPHAMSYASPCFLAYAPYYALCSMPHASLSIPPMPVFPALFVVPTLFVRNRGRLHFMSPVDVTHQTGLVQ